MTRLRLLWPVALVALLVAFTAWWPLGAQPAPASPPLFTVGTTYVVLWECLPEYVAQAVSKGMAGGEQLNPCYAEEVTVQQIRSDGWLLVTDEGGNGWTVNPARMIGFKVAMPPVRAAR